MTECERIVAEGLLPNSFFDEEVRCDFLVTTERKKIWAIQLDMLRQVDLLCKKHNLHYFLVAGSLLGAVRHNGFVPWDDDLDIALPRKDYETLLTLKAEFTYPYFLQTPYTDSGYYYSHAKLRNSRTAAVDFPFLYQGFNMGIFIDIHPLDYVLNEGARERFERINSLVMENSVAMRLTHPFLSERDKERVRNYTGNNPISNYEMIHQLSNPGDHIQSDTVAISVVTTYGFERCMYKAEDFVSTLEWDFEGFKAYIPIGYDRVLSTIYGDYHAMPPVEQRGMWHSNVRFYPDVPYEVIVHNMKMGLEK